MGSAVDVVVNLRYPARGETSGIGLRMMGKGKGVVTSDGEGLELGVGVGEEEILGETMREWDGHPGRVRREQDLGGGGTVYGGVAGGLS